uniref:Uncharacterized protein n=1 Tax=Tanacetum cinerariifolium TaxID=118510 RepID=A0A6L2MU27_TANCI|nr:hypothetical protein [Tanacetum cinerariifolium]
MKDKIEFRGRNELGNWANIPIFIGNFCVLTDFTVVKDIYPYLDEGIGEVVVGEPFCKVSCIETRRFDGIIIIHNNDESVTYQMVWSIPRGPDVPTEESDEEISWKSSDEEDDDDVDEGSDDQDDDDAQVDDDD